MIKKDRGEIRYGRLFGHADTHPGDGSQLSNMTMETRTEALAYFHACPVEKEMVEIYGLGPIFRRYMECNQIHKNELLERAMKQNFDLYKKMITPIKRVRGELPNPTINPNNIPPSFPSEMSPLSAPTGFAPSRLVLAWAGIYAGEKDGSGTNSRERVLSIKSKLDILVKSAKDPIELMLTIGEEAIRSGANSNQIIEHIMSAGILQEQGCRTMYREILSMMENTSPILHKLYQKMNENVDKMRNDGVIPIVDLK